MPHEPLINGFLSCCWIWCDHRPINKFLGLWEGWSTDCSAITSYSLQEVQCSTRCHTRSKYSRVQWSFLPSSFSAFRPQHWLSLLTESYILGVGRQCEVVFRTRAVVERIAFIAVLRMIISVHSFRENNAEPSFLPGINSLHVCTWSPEDPNPPSK